MARYIGPLTRLCRREGTHLFLKGTKCERKKCSAERRSFPPGQHGQLRVKLSDYGIQLREKQKVKRMYGLLERQFRRFFSIAATQKGVTGHKLLELLERRLDNVLYRSGLASSRLEARQIVSHGGVKVNDRSVDIPSFLVGVGDVVRINPDRKHQTTRVKGNLERLKDRQVPGWLQVDTGSLSSVVSRVPQRNDIEQQIQEQLIVELYSK